MSTNNRKSRKTASYQFNFPLLIGTVLIGLLIAALGYWWHQRSMAKIADQFATRARQSQASAEQLDAESVAKRSAGDVTAAEDLAKQAREQRASAINMLWQYLQMRREDAAVRVELANAYGNLPEAERSPRRALELFRAAIVSADAQAIPQLRLRLAEVLNQSQQYDEAVEEGVALIESVLGGSSAMSPADINRAWSHLAIALAGRWQSDDAKKPDVEIARLKMNHGSVFWKALELNPTDWKMVLAVAGTLRSTDAMLLPSDPIKSHLKQSQTELAAWADQLVERAIAANQNDGQARLANFFYRNQFGLAKAADELKAANEQSANNAPILTLLAEWHLQQVSAETRAILLNPNANRADIPTEMMEHVVAAKELFTKCYDLGQFPLPAFVGLAESCLLLGDATSAEKYLVQGIESSEKADAVGDKALPLLFQRLVASLLQRQQYAEAEQWLVKWQDETTERSRNRNSDPREIAESMHIQDLYRGMLLLEQDQLERALPEFEKVLVADGRQGERAIDIYRMIGNAFLQRSAPARAAHYFELAQRIATGRPDLARLAALARALSGQLDLARAHWERVITLQPTTENWLEYAELLYQIQFQRNPVDRQWIVVENALNRAEQQTALIDPKREQTIREALNRLRSAIALAQNPLQVNELPTGEALESLSVGELRSWINILRTSGNEAALVDFATRLENKLDDPLEKMLAKSQRLVFQRQPDEAMVCLEAAKQTASDGQRPAIISAIAQLQFLRGNIDQFFDELTGLVTDPKVSPGFRKSSLSRLVDAAIQMNRIDDQPAAWESELKALEGAQGPFQSYLSIWRSLRSAADSSDNALKRQRGKQAEDAARQLLVQQADWGAANTLLGMAYDLQLESLGDEADANTVQTLRRQALLAYQQAYNVGDRRPAMVLRLSELLDSPEEAARILSALSEDLISNNPALFNQLTAANMLANQWQAAEEVAVSATRARPKSVSAWINLALVQWRQSKFSEANLASEQALQVARGDTGTAEDLLSVFRYFVTSSRMAGEIKIRDQQLQQARALVDALVAKEPAADQAFARGSLLDVLGDDEAATWYLQAERDQPEAVEQLKTMLNFFSRKTLAGLDTQEIAIRLATRLSKLQPEDTALQSQLANLLVTRGRPEDWDEAAKILQRTSRFQEGTAEGQRAQAILLWERQNVPNEIRQTNLQSMVEILTPLTRGANSRPEDFLLLGNALVELVELNSANGSNANVDVTSLRDQALTAFRTVAQLSQLDTNQLIVLALALIDLEQWEMAETASRRLEDSLRDEQIPNPAPLAIRIEILKKQGKLADTTSLEQELLAFIDRLDQRTKLLTDLQRSRIDVQVAAIWESLDKPTQALELYRRASSRSEEMLQSLVLALIRGKQKIAALQLCEQAFEQRPNVTLVFLATAILTTGKTSPEEHAAAETLLQKMRQKFGNDLNTLANLANIRSCQPGQEQTAIELYLECLRLNPNQALIMNNLATVYGEMPDKLDEALRLIDQAIKIEGNQPALLNTKARILMNRKELDAARQLLRSIAQRGADPRFWWQLAETEWAIHLRDGDAAARTAAEQAWRQAQTNGIDNAVLTPVEYSRLEDLRKQLQPASTPGIGEIP